MSISEIQKWILTVVAIFAVIVLFWGVATLSGISIKLGDINQKLTALNDTNQKLKDIVGLPYNPFRTDSGSLSGIQGEVNFIETHLGDINSQLDLLNKYGLVMK